MTTALTIPDPRQVPVPRGWAEEYAAPVILAESSWEALDHYEAELKALASAIDSLDGDVLEFEKALRMVEKRRGELLGPEPELGRPPDNVPRMEHLDESRPTIHRWRKIARHWDEVWEWIRDATERKQVTQTAILKRIDGNVHFSSDSEEWYTPQNIIDRTVRLMGGIDLDPCAPESGLTVPSEAVFTKNDDGLSHDWWGRVYMNPPYGDEIKKWVDKLAGEFEVGEVTQAVALVPSRTDTGWFRRLRDYPRCFISGRLKFSGHDNSAPFPSMVVYMGADRDGFVREFSGLGDIYVRVE